MFEDYGRPDTLRVQQVEKPQPDKHQVLIKLHAASINSWDWEIVRGVPFANRLLFGVRRPKKILGCDVAGTVEAVGPEVKRFQEGDEVYGDVSHWGWGGFAEYVCAKESALILKPETMTFSQAAAMSQAAVLALQGLRKGLLLNQVKTIHVSQSPKKVLINGASGGVGSFAVLIAKRFGAHVTGVCRTEKMDFVRSLGADKVLDYTRQDCTASSGQYNLILDVMAHHPLVDYKRALAPNGRLIVVGGDSTLINRLLLLGPWISITSGKRLNLLIHKPSVADLEYLKSLFLSGGLTPKIDREFPLSEAVEAVKYFGEGHVRGKVVITMDH